VKKQGILENQVKLSYLALGSNFGNKIQNLTMAKFELENHKINIIKSSSNFLSLSWPDPSKPKFVNLVLEVNSSLAAIKLLRICKLIEKKLGRVKSKKNAPRSCDIDIIDYDNKVIKDKNLVLPHPRMITRNFVLLPLYELNKSWKHPESKINIVKLINSLPIKDLRSIKKI
jgi:2-amino-4-hydroxy-6-hydroxymethyldihydropteridine diphosphokinase